MGYDRPGVRAPRMKRMLPLLATGALVYALVCAGAYFLQERLVYFPGAAPLRDPSSVGLAFEERRARTADGLALHAWWIPAEGARAAVLVSHGNAGSIEGRLHLARAFHEMGFGVLLYDYRGYGGNAGRPDEEGTYLDAEAAWELLTRELAQPPGSIVLYGESLGGAVAVELARRRPEAAALVIEASFTSLAEVGARAYPWLPVRWLARHRYESIEKVGALALPILVLHSPEDDVVPIEQGRALCAAAGTRARLVTTRGSHNAGGFTLEPGYRAAVRAFVLASLDARERTEGTR